jgi:hypothetical protein
MEGSSRLVLIIDRAGELCCEMLDETLERTIRRNHLNRRTEPGDDCGGRHKTGDASQEVPTEERQIGMVPEVSFQIAYQKAVPYVYI